MQQRGVVEAISEGMQETGGAQLPLSWWCQQLARLGGRGRDCKPWLMRKYASKRCGAREQMNKRIFFVFSICKHHRFGLI